MNALDLSHFTDAENPQQTFRYRILRYTPNIVRDEWVNIGVLLEDVRAGRVAVRLIEQQPEFARVARIHPDLDEELLRALPTEFNARLRAAPSEVTAYLEKLNQTLSNTLQLSPQRALLADNFDEELDRLYRAHVSPPSKRAGGMLHNLREMMRAKLSDVFRRHRILGKLETQVRVEGFTQPGDPMRLDFGYQNGVRGFIHSVALKRDAAQAKVLAYTAASIHAHDSTCEVTAVTEEPPLRDNKRHRFIANILSEQNVRIVPMNQIEGFAEELRVRLQ